jgi:hypothetical protein
MGALHGALPTLLARLCVETRCFGARISCADGELALIKGRVIAEPGSGLEWPEDDADAETKGGHRAWVNPRRSASNNAGADVAAIPIVCIEVVKSSNDVSVPVAMEVVKPGVPQTVH